MNILKISTTIYCHSANQNGHDSSPDTSPRTLFKVLVMMLVMAVHDSGQNFVNDAPQDESYANKVLIMMLITTLRMNDDDGPDNEHVANTKCLLLTPCLPR
jgi:hypothetical protein